MLKTSSGPKFDLEMSNVRKGGKDEKSSLVMKAEEDGKWEYTMSYMKQVTRLGGAHLADGQKNVIFRAGLL